ncbi:retrovirus-related pol polyprotein from transposon TNT 1-94 [Tanacetum coccineum]
MDSGLVSPSFLPIDDLIASLNKVPTHDTYLDNHVIYQSVHESKTKNAVVQDTSSFAQQDKLIMSVIEDMSNQVAKCNKVDIRTKTINESLTTKLERYKDQIKIFEERQKCDLNDREKYIHSQLREVIIDRNAKVFASQNQIHSLKLQLSTTVESHKTLSTTVDVLKKESKAKEDKYLKEIIDLEKKKKALDNVHDALSVIDTEETLELAEESMLKMHAKQNDPIAKDKKVNIAPIDYAALNKLSEHFVKHFVRQKQLFVGQAFSLPISKPVSEIAPVQPEPVLKEIPRELPTISLVKDSFNKMRSHVNDFDKVITVRTKLIITQDLMHTAVKSYVAIADYQSMEKSYIEEYDKNLKLDTKLSKMNDMENKQHADSLCRIVEQARPLNPIEEHLGYACKFTTRIQELLVYVTNTCPSSKVERLKGSTSASGSQPLGNTKKNRISQTTSSNQKNKVEDHLRSVKSSLNKKNRVFECTAILSKMSAKSNKKKEWKPDGKVFTNVGHRWLPTGRTFNIDRTKCPMTRITSSKVVPSKETSRSNHPLGKVLRSKDETLEIVIKILKKIQVRLNATVRNIRTDNEIEFVNQKLKAYYEDVGISHQTSIARTPQQNGNCSLIRKPHNKIPYELLHDKQPELTYFHVFSALCYTTNDGEDLGKLKPKADIRIFIGYAPAKRAYQIYNMRTYMTMETIHVDFDELTAMASKQFDQDNPTHVYKLKKALYDLKQSPRAWYDMLSSFLLSQKFFKGVVDPTLFTRKEGKDILMFLGDRLVSWSSKKHKRIAISSTEAKYIALSGCYAQILWMRSQLTDYEFAFNKIPLYCEHKNDIALCCNNVQHSRLKHIDVRYHFIKEQVKNGVVELYLVRTEYQLANIFTKALARERIEFLINKLGMKSILETHKSLAEENEE